MCISRDGMRNWVQSFKKPKPMEEQIAMTVDLRNRRPFAYIRNKNLDRFSRQPFKESVLPKSFQEITKDAHDIVNLLSGVVPANKDNPVFQASPVSASFPSRYDLESGLSPVKNYNTSPSVKSSYSGFDNISFGSPSPSPSSPLSFNREAGASYVAQGSESTKIGQFIANLDKNMSEQLKRGYIQELRKSLHSQQSILDFIGFNGIETLYRFLTILSEPESKYEVVYLLKQVATISIVIIRMLKVNCVPLLATFLNHPDDIWKGTLDLMCILNGYEEVNRAPCYGFTNVTTMMSLILWRYYSVSMMLLTNPSTMTSLNSLVLPIPPTTRTHTPERNFVLVLNIYFRLFYFLFKVFQLNDTGCFPTTCTEFW